MHSGRRKRNKNEALYGVFRNSGSDDEGAGSRSKGSSSRGHRREVFEFVAATSSTSQSQAAPSADQTRKVRFAKPEQEPDRDDDDDDSMSDGSDGVRGPNRDGRDDMDVDDDDEDDDDEDEDDEDEDERLDREAREAAFKAQKMKSEEDLDDYEDKVVRPQMGSKPVIGLSTQAPVPESPDNTQSKNKAMAASIKAGLGLSNDAGSPSSRDNSPRIHQRSRNGNGGSMGFFKNRVGFQGTDSKDNSPSPRPGSPAMTSSPQPDSPSVAPIKVDKDYGAFSEKGSGFGLKMLEKMGWKKGYGLGAGGSGIVEPIQTKLRPVKMGIGFKGFKEKTDQDRAEEKRRGLVVSSDEEEQPDKRKSKGNLKKESDIEVKADGWKKTSGRSSRKGPKVEYKTAAEIQQEIESGDLPMAQAQPQKILDMTGKTVRELTSASQIRTAVAMSHERFPELRHNMELMADISTTDLEQMARTQKSDHVRIQVLEKESVRIQRQVEKDELDLERLAKVMTITDQCARIADEIRHSTSDTTGATAVEMQEDLIAKAFQEPLDLFSGLYYDEYEMYQLDQIVVASLQDAFKKLFKDWDVLKNPTRGAGLFRNWQKLFKTSKVSYSQNWTSANVDSEGNGYYGGKPAPQDSMTAYESLLHHHWLPKVRSALNNAWDPRDFDPVIQLLEAWAPPVLPLFMQDNIVTQLVLPKLHKEIEKWSPRDSLMLHTWIHPWLPILGQSRMDQELFGDVRRKLSTALAAWQVLDPSALTVLTPWRSVFEAADMELLLLKSVLPKLVEGLGAFEVNPRDQKIEILQAVLPWHPFFPSTTFSSLLVNEFFPKWHQVLYLWLTHPTTTELDEISQWYQWWKSSFPTELLQETGVATGFRQGLDMINQFMAGLKIMAPADVAQAQAQSKGRAGGPTNGASLDSFGRLQTKKHLVQSVSFKDLVQDYATQNSLLFVMTKQSHERSGRPLYRLGGNSTGTAGGILVHMTEEVAFVKAEDTGVWMPTGLEELMVLAGGGKDRGA
ncbi:MAG: GC-rich sequence DNA-binding factor-like protein-domain-containing protein [Linnemannia gamsii]|nr:MAG: GC-rich sequence DNA-binding factor-like protein-domain-containing protein [Linnemannia gamsii]